MKSKYNTIIGISLAILFVISFVTGHMAEHDSGFGHFHEFAGTLALLFVILHLIGYRKIIFGQIKNLLVK